MAVDDIALVIDREIALLSVEVRSSPTLVQGLLDPDFQEIGASGRLWSRSEIISVLADEASASPVTVTDMVGRTVSPDLILLTYVTTTPDRKVRRCSLWRRSEQDWRILFHQGTVA